MSKIKTRKSAVKRFKVTGTGKIVRTKACRNHLLGKKTRKKKRNLRKEVVVSGADAKRLKRMLVI